MVPATHLLLPEIIIAAGIGAVLLATLVARGTHATARLAALAAALALGVAVGQAAYGVAGAVALALVIDRIALAARIGVLLATLLVLLAAPSSRELEGRERGEYHLGLLGLALGGLVFAGAADLLTLYLGLEFLSLSGYALAGFRAGDRAASEAGLKYVLFGALASALTLMGMSYLYGLSGSLDLAAIGTALAAPQAGVAMVGAVLLTLVGVAFKLSLVPFHLYGPDVYQGAPTLSAASIAVVPKIAAVAVAAHLLAGWLPAGSPGASAAIALLAVASMTVGNLSALAQRDAKRILALSGVAHAGYLVLALAAWPRPGALGAVGFYLIAYLVGNLGAFIALSLIQNRTGGTALTALAGAWRREPLAAVALAVALVSLAGIPPLAGFTAKWVLLRSVVDAGLADDGRGWLLAAAVVLLANAVLSVFPYIRILRATLVEAGEAELAASGERRLPALAALGFCTAATLILGVLWGVVALFRDYLG